MRNERSYLTPRPAILRHLIGSVPGYRERRFRRDCFFLVLGVAGGTVGYILARIWGWL